MKRCISVFDFKHWKQSVQPTMSSLTTGYVRF